MCFAQIGQFLKPFEFPSNFYDYSLSSLFKPLSNSPCLSKKTSIFSSFQPQSPKGMGFLTLTKYFIFLTLVLLICEFLLSIVLHGVSDMGLLSLTE